MSATVLKIIAILSMLIDHIGFACGYYFSEIGFAGGYYLCRAIGRLALPIFAFLIANGFRHTRSITKYALRLFAFAIISEVPFDLFTSHKITIVDFSGRIPNLSLDNVFFTLLIGLLYLCFNKYATERFGKLAKVISAVALVGFCAFAGFVSADYGAVGVAWVALFGLLDIKESKNIPVLFMGAAVLSYWRIIAKCIVVGFYRLTMINIGKLPGIAYFLAGNITVMTWIQPFALVAFGAMLMYNGKSGLPENPVAKKIVQYGFYLFYPVHILLLYLIF